MPAEMTATRRTLPKSFFLRDDILAISKELLGKYLVTRFNGVQTAGKIVETEAYDGTSDRASHAYKDKRTKRTEVMFRQGGVAYVYLCYGIHHLFNIITGKKNIPHAILIRALEPVEGIDTMLKRRKKDKIQRNLTAGPGTVSQALGITTAFHGTSLVQKKSNIWLEDGEEAISDQAITTGPRVGIDYAGDDVHLPWRFRIRDSKWTSKPK